MSGEESAEPAFDLLVDARGLRCPEPVMLLHNGVRKLIPGQVVKLIATDPSTQRDVSRFCTYLEHELVAQWVCDAEYCYFIRRGG